MVLGLKLPPTMSGGVIKTKVIDGWEITIQSGIQNDDDDDDVLMMMH